MSYGMCSSNLRTLMCGVAAFLAMTAQAPAAQHLWSLNEIYSNSTGTLQFIELRTSSGSQNVVGNFSINVTNGTTNTFTLPPGNLPGNTANHFLLFGTSGLQAAGGPAPDYIIPNNFLFTAGGSISFFGNNSGTYSAIPTDGILSRTWTGGNATNSPTNYTGVAGSVPEPAFVLTIACGLCGLVYRRRSA